MHYSQTYEMDNDTANDYLESMTDVLVYVKTDCEIDPDILSDIESAIDKIHKVRVQLRYELESFCLVCSWNLKLKNIK